MDPVKITISNRRANIRLLSHGKNTLRRAISLMEDLSASAIGRKTIQEQADEARDALTLLQTSLEEHNPENAIGSDNHEASPVDQTAEGGTPEVAAVAGAEAKVSSPGRGATAADAQAGD